MRHRVINFSRPYTVAYGLSDSPIESLGWMLETYHSCIYNALNTDETNIIPGIITIDEFLTQVSIY